MHRCRQYHDAPTHARGTEASPVLVRIQPRARHGASMSAFRDPVLVLPLGTQEPVAPPDPSDAPVTQLGQKLLLGARPAALEPVAIGGALLLMLLGSVGERPDGAPHVLDERALPMSQRVQRKRRPGHRARAQAGDGFCPCGRAGRRALGPSLACAVAALPRADRLRVATRSCASFGSGAARALRRGPPAVGSPRSAHRFA